MAPPLIQNSLPVLCGRGANRIKGRQRLGNLVGSEGKHDLQRPTVLGADLVLVL